MGIILFVIITRFINDHTFFMEYTLAIDFGTTNSTVYLQRRGKKEQLWNNEATGEYLFPSFVAYKKDEVVTGYAAKRLYGMDRQFVVSCVKRLIGLTYESYLKLEKKDIFGCEVVCGDDGYPYFVVSADGRKVSCIDVACELFKWIKRSAETVAEHEFTHAYVTRPANFRENQVTAIRDAARKAGLIIDKMISEPSAASISWCFKEDGRIFSKLRRYSTVLVIDFGGGTLDLSIVRYLGTSQFRVIDSAGDPNLGGNDIDAALQEYVLEKIRKMGHTIDKNDRRSKRMLRMLKKSCEEFKILFNSKLRDADDEEDFFRLNRNAVGDLDISYFGFDEQEISITAREFYEALKEPLERYLVPLNKITGKPEQMIGTIKNVLLVGGSSLLKFLRLKLMSKGFTSKQFQDVDAMHCVSEGAYQLLSLYTNPDPKKFFTEALPLSYGLQSGDDEVCLMLTKGSTVPCCSRERDFTNLEDYPEYIYSKVYQYPEETNQSVVKVSDCDQVWTLRFFNPEQYRRQRSQQSLSIQFKLDVGGTLEVICKDKRSGDVLHREVCNVLFDANSLICYRLVLIGFYLFKVPIDSSTITIVYSLGDSIIRRFLAPMTFSSCLYRFYNETQEQLNNSTLKLHASFYNHEQ